MLDRLRTLAAQRESFAFETTLAARSYTAWLRSLRQTGYAVHLVYFWLVSADLAVARVAERVRMGGHSVPEATVRQRYVRSVHNFFSLYRPLADQWRVYDNSRTGPTELVAWGDASGTETILQEEVWRQMQRTSE